MTVTGIQLQLDWLMVMIVTDIIYQNISNEHASITEFNEKKIFC